MKRLFTLLVAASCLAAAGQVPDYVPTDGLVAWFPCDSSVQDLTNNYTPEVEDFDGYLHGASGEAYGALSFDGENDFIRLDGNPTFENSSFSIGLWLKTSVGEFGPIVHVGRDDGQENNGFSLGVGGTTINLPGQNLMAHFSGVGYFDVSSFIPHESWQHVCITWDSSLMTFYVQGDAVGSLETPSTFTVPSSKLYLAAFSETVYQKFGGALDEIGIWNRSISGDEVLTLYNASLPVMGCTDSSACNFDEEATLDDGSCVSCDLVASFCGLGTIWDPNTQTCIGDGSGDINLDGCVQLNDLLDLLSAYGDCGAEESTWQCGDPLAYQGYDYATVLIGEQCWFAENARYMPEVAPAAQAKLTPEAPLAFVYGYQGTDTLSAQAEENYQSFGALYNFEAVSSWHLCPSGWHVPSDEDWFVLDEFIGLPSDDVVVVGWRGTQEGASLKSAYAWDGTDDWGFNALPGGRVNLRQWNSEASYFGDIGQLAHFWTSGSAVVPEIDDWGETQAFNRYLNGDEDRYGRGDYALGFGMSVRCIQNAE